MQAAVQLPNSRFLTLSPEDMLIHSATHLMFNDELRGGLRDLVDMQMLCQHFAEAPEFWENLPERALTLGLGRPLFYALLSLQQILQTPIPEPVFFTLSDATPNHLIRHLMMALIQNLFAPDDVDHQSAKISQQLLYLRSHWVRMPPLMLIRHLATKAWATRKN